jgi:ribosomal protein S18 acetylase RimI-like enzyme
MHLRTATSEDFDFLYCLHRTALKEYVAQTWGWDEAWQQEHFRQRFNSTASQVVVYEGQDVGVLCVERREAEIFLSLIEVLPEYQRKGIGTALIRAILDEARQMNKTVKSQVLKVNIAARRLYERLGYSIVDTTETHYVMTVGGNRR